MFFIGATGQLLTLILTVCLPMVFLFSSKTPALSEKDLIIAGKHKICSEVISDSRIFVQSEITDRTVEEIQIPVIKNEVLQKIPLPSLIQKPVQFYIQSSGNKAPPVFHC